MPRTSSKIAASKPRASDTSAPLTHERIQADLAAFRKAGGRIEKLGNTRVLTKVEVPEDGT